MNDNVRIRLLAMVMLLGGCAMLGMNAWEIRAEGSYSPKFMMLGGLCLLVAPFFLVVGRPTDPATGKQPMWWHVTTGFLALLGVGAGAWVSFFVLQ
jgi:hypothetical protein